ncbi:hypothetical protein BDP81DRAFT_392665 [Colletotrichum phormii]|uniref:Uncharacterized protein n=1 Tax=Colletotrichum phormii TaxID=359342 RepID=A0AAI9ZTT6_9PEZI|nr:uncharacterized protein BDP81DRAFT_392665 [Colletotrichum phormii]KAK1638041.1 hypothetical protein BDP81DRAFT_392665 [Colletotrichum phormii]
MARARPSSSNSRLNLREILEEGRSYIAACDKRRAAGWPLRKYNDLTASEKEIPDRWMARFYECNHLGKLDTAEARETARAKLWGLVFSTWDTDSSPPQPARLVARKTTDSIFKIGILREDVEPSKKRKADDSSVPAPASRPHGPRSRGADVFIKADINWATEDLGFSLCDARGANFTSDIKFEWTHGYYPSFAMEECAKVYWNRYELLYSLKNNLGGRDEASLPEARTIVRWPSNSTDVAAQLPYVIDKTPDNANELLTSVKLCADL